MNHEKMNASKPALGKHEKNINFSHKDKDSKEDKSPQGVSGNRDIEEKSHPKEHKVNGIDVGHKDPKKINDTLISKEASKDAFRK